MTAGTSNADNRAVFRNAIAQYGSVVVNIGLGLLLTPALLRGLGEQRFGYYTVVLALIGYVGLGELGLGTATVRRIAAEFAQGNEAAVSRVASTARAIYLGTATTCAVLVLVATLVLGSIVNASPEVLAQAQLALVVLGVAASVNFVFTIFPAILIGAGRSDLLVLSGSAVSTLGSVAQIITVTVSDDLRNLAIVSAASTVLGSLVSRYVAVRRYPTLRVRVRDARWSVARELLGSGWRNAVITIGTLAAYNADVLIVGAFLSVSAVTAYGVATRAAGLMSTVTFRVSDVLVPTYAHHDSTGDHGKLYDIYLETTLASMAIALPVSAVFVAFGDPILAAWLGHTPPSAPAVLAVLSLALVVAVPGGTAFFLLSGINRLGFAVKMSILTGLANAALGIALTPMIGLTGPALATLVMRGIFDLFVLPVHVCHLLDQPVAGWWRAFLRVVTPSIAVTGALAAALHFVVGSGPRWEVALSCGAIALAHVMVFGAAAGSERRQRYTDLLRSRSRPAA